MCIFHLPFFTYIIFIHLFFIFVNYLLITFVIVSILSDNPFIVVSKSIVLLKSTPKIEDNNNQPLIIKLFLYLDFEILFNKDSNIKD